MNDNPNFKPRPLALAVAIATGAVPAGAANAAAGRVAFAWGEVSVESSNGQTSEVKRGAELQSGDTVTTERGRAQLRFTDGSFVSLQPKTSFKIDDYNYEQEQSSGDRSVFSLFRGGLRTITGIIGRRNQSAYRVNTPVATIGIRGTAYKLLFRDDGSLFLECDDGNIFATNDGGTTLYNAGNVGVVLNQLTKPQLVRQEEGQTFLVLPPPERLVEEENEDEIGDDGDADEVLVNITDLDADQIFDILLAAGLSAEEAALLLANAGFDFMLPEPMVPPPGPTELLDGAGYTAAFSFFCEGCGFTPIADKEEGVTADFTAGKLEGWVNAMGDAANRGMLTQAPESGSDQYIGWARWVSDSFGQTFDPPGPDNMENFDGGEGMHMVIGRPTDLSMLASPPHNGRFSLLASTVPTNAAGDVGTFNGGTFFVDFAAQQVDGSAKFNFGPKDYEVIFANLAAPNGTFVGAAGVSSMAGCMGCIGCSGKVAGLVAGPGAERGGFTYYVNDPYMCCGADDMFGAAVFQQNPAGPLPPAP